jgi:hypothetical protein
VYWRRNGAFCMTDTPSRYLSPGMTRNCLDPWQYVEFRPNGDVGPCCARVIGNLSSESLGDILNGPTARQLRSDLLHGRPDLICRECGLKSEISPPELSKKIRSLFDKVTVPEGFDADAYIEANPDVLEAGDNPVEHFLRYGRFEGRPLRNSFEQIIAAPLPNRNDGGNMEHPWRAIPVRHLRDLVALEGSAFVSTCYMTILNRRPDPKGLENYLAELRSGTEKFMIISRLRNSFEGKRLGRRLRGYRTEVARRYLLGLIRTRGASA